MMLAARHGGTNPWLYGGEHCPPERLRKLDRSEERGGIQIVLTGLIDDADEAFKRRRPVGDRVVDLAPLERHFIALVLEAQHEFSFIGAHSWLVEEVFDLELTPPNPGRFVPV